MSHLERWGRDVYPILQFTGDTALVTDASRFGESLSVTLSVTHTVFRDEIAPRGLAVVHALLHAVRDERPGPFRGGV
jgi:hypothetical protein